MDHRSQAPDTPTVDIIPDTAAALGPAPDEAATSSWAVPFEIPIGDRLITCMACGARRDWLLIRHRDAIHVRCRCTHQWCEPALPVSWYAANHGPIVGVYRTGEEVNRLEGFDGTFAGTYL
ncbi:hypothetical protein [Streptomyces carpaticus]|uniref:hypothetical protein n=1 Tax=Streptomyces carpaticus TaxID=285558 RepID=UPI0031FA0EA3